MKTHMMTNGDQVTISLEGCLDFESTDRFRLHLDTLVASCAQKNVTFDFSNLEFVGSSGISGFIQSLREFNLRADKKPRYTNVGVEFRKMIVAFDESNTFLFSDGRENKLRIFDN